MCSELQIELDRTTKIEKFIQQSLDGIEIENSDRARISLSCCHLVFEHHQATRKLVESELYASSATLLRPMFESAVRGNWLLFCATDSHIARFIEKDDIKKSVCKQIQQLELQPAYSNGWISEIYSSAYQIMHSLTHPGIQQVGRRIQKSTISRAFKDVEVIDILEASNKISLFTAITVAIAADEESLVTKIGEYSVSAQCNSFKRPRPIQFPV